MFSKYPFFKIITVIAILTGLIVISGCSSAPKRHHSSDKGTILFTESNQQTSAQKRLARHFRNWKRTPYRLGGYSKRGIDCSGFVQITYRDVFLKKIPRTTKRLASIGEHVSQNNLKFGDLVFFRTSRKVRHVGIYIGRGKFIHASTSRGVMQSNLGSTYWKTRYWKAKRLLG